MELAAQDERPVPREVRRKQGQSKGPGANAKPAEVVLTTRAARQKQRRCSIRRKVRQQAIFHINQPITLIMLPAG